MTKEKTVIYYPLNKGTGFLLTTINNIEQKTTFEMLDEGKSVRMFPFDTDGRIICFEVYY